MPSGGLEAPMIDDWLSDWLRWLGGRPCFRIHARARREPRWRVVSVYATDRRNRDARWPLWRATCVTWTSRVIAVGWDFAADVLREQAERPASRQRPVAVGGGRLHDWRRRLPTGAG